MPGTRITSRLALAALLAVLLAAGPGAAQEGCTQADPCVLPFDVDTSGFQDEGLPDAEFTVGDWFVLDIMNFDDVEHRLSLTGHSVQLTVPADENATSAAFQLNTVGEFQLQDSPSGDAVAIFVRDYDVPERDDALDGEDGDGSGNEGGDGGPGGSGGSGEGNDTPGFGAALALLAIAAAACAPRRK